MIENQGLKFETKKIHFNLFLQKTIPREHPKNLIKTFSTLKYFIIILKIQNQNKSK